jgi:serine/threonine protein phosphatase 1
MSEKTELRGPEFSTEVQRQHRRVDTDSWENIYVVGDVHGCPKELDRLFSEISPTEDELVVFVGDLINKGPDSQAVIERVRQMENAVSVRGNNEQKLLDGKSDIPSLEEDDRSYIESMPVVVSWKDNLVVHGGVSPEKPLKQHSQKDLQETRSLYGGGYDGVFWFEKYGGDRRVFFGHTVLDAPLDGGEAIGLDTGCVYGGMLTAYDCGNDEFVAVDSERKYRERSQSHIVSTRSL